MKLALGLLSAIFLAVPASASDLERVVADYVGLYRRDTLAEWKKLFLPHFTVASTREDGTVGERTLEEFYEAQRGYLESGRAIEEVLEKSETAISAENKVRTAILAGTDPQQAYLQFGKF